LGIGVYRDRHEPIPNRPPAYPRSFHCDSEQDAAPEDFTRRPNRAVFWTSCLICRITFVPGKNENRWYDFNSYRRRFPSDLA